MKTRNVIFILNLICSGVLFCSDGELPGYSDPGSTNEPSDPEQTGTDSKTHDEIMHDHDHDQLPKKPKDQTKTDPSHNSNHQSPNKDISLFGPDGPDKRHQAEQKPTSESTSQAENSAAEKSTEGLSDEFSQKFQDDDPSKASSPKETKLSPREEENKELLDVVEDQLKGKLSDSQIKVVKEVTDSYLERLHKKLLQKMMKKFLKNMVKMIFKVVRSAQRINGAVTDHDVWVICKKEYAKELSRLDAAKKKYISAKRSKRIKKLNSKK